MILACQNISKSFADKTVLRNVNFHIEDKEKYWNEMVVKLFNAFDEHMEMNIHKYLNMYIKGNNTITEY